MLEWLFLFLLIICIVFILILVIKLSRLIDKKVYYRLYKLNVPVEIKVNRELMNEYYTSLEEEEQKVLRDTANAIKVYLVRKIKNDLDIVIIKKGFREIKMINIYKSEEDENSSLWIKYLLKNKYFRRKVFLK